MEVEGKTRRTEGRMAPLTQLRNEMSLEEEKLQTAFDSADQILLSLTDKISIQQTGLSLFETKNSYMVSAYKVIQALQKCGSVEETTAVKEKAARMCDVYKVLKQQLKDLYRTLNEADDDQSSLQAFTVKSVQVDVGQPGLEAATVAPEEAAERVESFPLNPLTDEFVSGMTRFHLEPTDSQKVDVSDRQKIKSAARRKNSSSSSSSSKSLAAGLASFTKQLMKNDVCSKFASQAPFTGVATEYQSWKAKFEAKIQPFLLSEFEIIAMLESQTGGEPQRLVKTYSSAYADNPKEGLNVIWRLLEKRYGASNQIAKSIRSQLNALPILRATSDTKTVQSFLDVCYIALSNQARIKQLVDLDHASGLKVVREKLPEAAQRRWMRFGTEYESKHLIHPPFAEFVQFLETVVNEVSNEDYAVSTAVYQKQVSDQRAQTKSFKTVPFKAPASSFAATSSKKVITCIIHQNAGHQTEQCSKFLAMKAHDRGKAVWQASGCFRCLGKHSKGSCKGGKKCNKCESTHHALLHAEPRATPAHVAAESSTSINDERNSAATSSVQQNVLFGKIFAVEVEAPTHSLRKVKTLAIIDEGSDTTFVHPSIIHDLNVPSESHQYSLITLDGKSFTQCRKAKGLRINGVGLDTKFDLPEVLTCKNLPDCKKFLATRLDTQNWYPGYESLFEDENSPLGTGILIGRDVPEVLKMVTHGDKPPYLIESKIGYSLLGATSKNESTALTTSECDDVFQLSPFDELDGLSRADQKFVKILEKGVSRDEKGHLQFPLPFKDGPTPNLPDNKTAVRNRMISTTKNLVKRPDDLRESIKFMEKSIKAGHVEQLDDVDPYDKDCEEEQTYYIPIFTIRHPKKDKLRVVFDSAARYEGVSLNDVLLTGPDANSRLTSVLNRFREDVIATCADVTSMFHAFAVDDAHRNFQRFFWFEDNDPNKKLAVYRANVMIFGNTSSPGVAIFGLRFACKENPEIFELVKRSFYIDDMLLSSPDAESAVEIVSRTVDLLSKSGIELAKFISNDKQVKEALKCDDHESPETVEISSCSDEARSLGLIWKVEDDVFKICRPKNVEAQPFTLRGLLATVNSIFDPLGLIAPVVLAGRIMLRRVNSGEWDTPIEDEKLRVEWGNWLNELQEMDNFAVSRPVAKVPSTQIKSRSLHCFCDASTVSIGYAIYMRSIDKNDKVHVNLITANSKLTPKATVSIPRLELAACVEGAKATSAVIADLTMKPDEVYYHTDSMVVLGYIQNWESRYAVYVANRIGLIHQMTSVEQWRYVPTKLNPADLACRPTKFSTLQNSFWLSGPYFLKETVLPSFEKPFEVSKVELPEVILTTTTQCLATVADEKQSMFDNLYKKTTSWVKVQRIAKTVIDAAVKWLKLIDKVPNITSSNQTVVGLLIRDAQLSCVIDGSSVAANLNPYNDNGIIRVGGRLNNAQAAPEIVHPFIVPAEHPVAEAIFLYHHAKIKHQGRKLTTNELLSNGFYFPNRLVRRFMSKCVICKKLRGMPSHTIMGSLPSERVNPSPAFTHSSCDCFGPFILKQGQQTRKTTTRKVWVVIFVCSSTRAIHLEMILSMDTASFILAFRRFVCLRGEVRTLRSDQGGNFIGAEEELKKENVKLILNTPYASHQGGSWERKIKSVRAIIEGALTLGNHTTLDFEEFATLLSEASAIVNNTPLVEADDLIEDLNPLTPAMLLSAKEHSQPPDINDEFTSDDLLCRGRNRWRRTQTVADNLWKRWSSEYRNQLQKRHKWMRPTRDFLCGDIVMLQEKNLKRSEWKIGKIMEALPGTTDGHVRKALVKFRNSILERPASSLILLVPACDASQAGRGVFWAQSAQIRAHAPSANNITASSAGLEVTRFSS